MIQCNNEKLNFNNICRLCMRHNGAMSSIFTDDTDGIIPSRILYCLSLKVLVNDGLPVLICEQCKHQLNCSFKFKTQCENSDATLRKYLSNITLRTEIKKEFQVEASRFDNIINCSDFSQQDEDCFTSLNVATAKQQQIIIDPSEQQANVKLENADELSYARDSAWNCNESSAEIPVDVKQCSIGIKGEQRVGINMIGDCVQIHSTKDTLYNEVAERGNDLSMEMLHTGTVPAAKNVVTSVKVPQIKVKMKEQSVTLNSNFGDKDMYIKELCNINQSPKKQYTCHLCFQSYAGRSGLWQHLQKHSGRQYVCSVCNKHFTRGNILKHHERTHAEVSSGIICPVCKKTFLNVMQFKRHEIDHLIDWSTAMQT